MNCCDHNPNGPHGNNRQEHKGGHLPHMLMMVLCCAVPLLILLAVPLLGANLSGLKIFLAGIAPFLCPLTMIGMVPMMLRHGKKEDGRCEERRIDPDEMPDPPKRDRLN